MKSFLPLPDKNEDIGLGYSILPAYQGKGYATEMAIAMVKWGLEQPGVRKITASCSGRNHASARVLEKAGFTKTCVQENELYWEIERLKV